MNPIVSFIKHGFTDAADPEKARDMQSYMKTGQLFYGVQAPERRKIAKMALKQYPIDSRDEYEEIIRELWEDKYRECMYQALEIAERCTEFRTPEAFPLFEYLVRTAPHWDTLDWIARKLISSLVLDYREFEIKLEEWSEDDNFWVRRASLLAHLHHKESVNTDLLSQTILKMTDDTEFFIRKAIGWVLRDYSYANPAWVKRFVRVHEGELSGMSKREALKHIKRHDL